MLVYTPLYCDELLLEKLDVDVGCTYEPLPEDVPLLIVPLKVPCKNSTLAKSKVNFPAVAEPPVGLLGPDGDCCCDAS